MPEYISEDQGKLLVRREEDVEPILDRAAALRSNGLTGMGKDNWLIGSIPQIVYVEWMRESGVSLADTEAVKEVLRKKMLDGDFSKFRVHEGTF